MREHNHSIIGHSGSGGEMADSRLVPPQPFDFRKPDEWPQWLRHFEQYRMASGLSTEGEEKQVNTLLYIAWVRRQEMYSWCQVLPTRQKSTRKRLIPSKSFSGLERI